MLYLSSYMHVDILLIINYSILFPWYYAMATGRCEETPEVSADRNPFSHGAALWNLSVWRDKGHNQVTQTQWQFQSNLHVAIPVLFKALLSTTLL